MNMYSHKSNGNYYVALDTLNQKLQQMSHGAYQWMAVPVLGIFLSPGQQPRSCVVLGFSNADETNLPNHLCYLFPAVALAGHSLMRPKLVVQLASGSMSALSRGLYWDEGSLKIDPMEDFFRVWIPLKRCLGLLEAADDEAGQEIEDQQACERSIRPEGQINHREALYRHLDWLSQCAGMIEGVVADDVDSEHFLELLSKAFRRLRRNDE